MVTLVGLAMTKDWMGYGTYNVWFERLFYTYVLLIEDYLIQLIMQFS